MEHLKLQYKVIYILLLCILASASGNLAIAADANLHVQFTTTNCGGNYAPKHVHVVWIKDTAGNFITTLGTSTTEKTRAIWGPDEAGRLTEWYNNNPQNTDDLAAVTGATPSTFETYTFDWDWRKENRTVVPDGDYEIHFLQTSDNAGTPQNHAIISTLPAPANHFNKGTTAWSYYSTSQGGYNNITLTFTPETVVAPVVTNIAATNITSNSATLNGNVTLDSDVTIYWGDNDGETGTWDSLANVGSVLSGNFSANISLPSPDTTYYFRCYASNAGGSDWADSSLSFITASATPNIYVSAQTLDFSDVPVGSQSDLAFDIQNTGTGDDLTVESLQITGLSKSAYSIISPPSLPFTLAAGSGIETITVRFEPAVYAEYDYACLSIGNDDPDSVVADVSLKGTGTMDAEVALSALSGVGGICNAVEFVGSNIIVAQGAMLTILDSSNPSSLQIIGTVRLSDIIKDITVVGNTVYAAIGASGIQVVDITTISGPVVFEAIDTPGHSYEVVSSGDILCVADGANGLLIYDISTPDTPLLQDTCKTFGSAIAVSISAATAYVLDNQLGLQSFDVTDPVSVVAHWKLDGNARDSIGGYDGTVNGDPLWSGGWFNGALELDGAGDYLEMKGYEGITGTQSRTVSAWIKTPTDGTIVHWGTGGPGGGNWMLHLNYTVSYGVVGALRLSVGGGRVTATTDLCDNAWHHVAVVLDGIGSLLPSSVKFYVDGVLESNSHYDDTYTINTVADADLLIGAYAGGIVPFTGLIDDVRVYDRVLNLSQIQSMYNASSNSLDELELGQELAVSGTKAYITDQLGNFFVVDITAPAAPSLLGQTRVSGGNGTSIAISGSYAYVTNSLGVEVFDISVPSTPVFQGVYSSTQASDIAIDGTVAYLAEEQYGLTALDVTSPTSPAVLGSFDFQTMPKAVAAGNSAAIIAEDTDGMQVVDLIDPANPEPVSSTSTGALGYTQDVAVSGSLAYMANGLLGLQIVDVSNLSVPALLGDYPTAGFASSVAVSGTTAMVADGRYAYVLDVSNSSSPALNGQWMSAGWAGGVAIEGLYGYVANGGMGIEVLNISDATSAGSLELPGVAYDIAVSGNTAYVAAGSEGLQIIDVSTPASPSIITSFDTPGMALGVTMVGSRVCVADKYSVAVIDVSNPAAPSLYGLSNVPVNSLSTDVVNSRLLVADGNAGIAILRAHAWPSLPIGDFDGNSIVELADLAMLAGDWLKNETMLDVFVTNLTDDTIVNMQDYAIMAANWLVMVDTVPPIGTMTWQSFPASTGQTSISMTATTVTDPSGVEYYFQCTAGGGHDSSWQSEATYEDTSLSPGVSYTYRVMVRDLSPLNNESNWSDSRSATTDPAPDLGGTLNTITGIGDLDLSGNIVYAIDVGGPGRTVGGLTFDRDDEDGTDAPCEDNQNAPGTTVSPYTPGYYPCMNDAAHGGNDPGLGDENLDELLQYCRNDSADFRVIQLDVTTGKTYKLQVLVLSTSDNDRRFDLSVGPDLGASNADSTWKANNLAVDSLMEQEPAMWTWEFTATTDSLWINCGKEVPQTGDDPNPCLSAIILENLSDPPPATDTVIITRADYEDEDDPSKGKLTIYATSTDGSSATLTVVGIATMTYNATESRYEYKNENTYYPSGGTVTVTSSHGGSDTHDVED